MRSPLAPPPPGHPATHITPSHFLTHYVYAGLYTYMQQPDAQLIGPECYSSIVPDAVALAALTGVASGAEGELDPDYIDYNTTLRDRVDWEAEGGVLRLTNQVSTCSPAKELRPTFVMWFSYPLP